MNEHAKALAASLLRNFDSAPTERLLTRTGLRLRGRSAMPAERLHVSSALPSTRWRRARRW